MPKRSAIRLAMPPTIESTIAPETGTGTYAIRFEAIVSPSRFTRRTRKLPPVDFVAGLRSTMTKYSAEGGAAMIGAQANGCIPV